MEKSIRNRAGFIPYLFHMWKKSSAYLNSDDMFSTYAQKTYMENIPCELALTNQVSGRPQVMVHFRLYRCKGM